MPLTTAENAKNVARRLTAVRASLETWRGALLITAAEHELPAARHITRRRRSGRHVTRRAPSASSPSAPPPRRASTSKPRDCAPRRKDAEAAYAELAAWMRSDLAPKASTKEACGEERYQRWSAYWSGATLDLHELYEWGYQDLRRINTRMWEIAQRTAPRAPRAWSRWPSISTTIRRERSTAPTRCSTMLKAFTARTTDELDGVHFDIDERIRFCDARLAPEGSAAAPYYINPSEDLSSTRHDVVPDARARRQFSWWRFASTWYHESIPGPPPPDRDGAARRRIARAASTGWSATPAATPKGGRSTPSDSWTNSATSRTSATNSATSPIRRCARRASWSTSDCTSNSTPRRTSASWATSATARTSAGPPRWRWRSSRSGPSKTTRCRSRRSNRYLGLPAQAISYKVGERMWLESREAAKQRLGDAFDLKAFHAHALVLGPMGLDDFAAEMALWDGGL